MSEWHGWSTRKDASDHRVGLHISPYIYRKSIALSVLRVDDRGARQYPLAYFRSEEDAREAMEVLDHLILNKPLPKGSVE